MWSMQCNVEFEYQLSICSGTKETTENLDRIGRSQDLPDANRLLASSPALNSGALILVPICAFFFPFPLKTITTFFFTRIVSCGRNDAYMHKYAYNYAYICKPKSKSKSKSLYDWQSVSQYALVSSTLVRLVTRYYFPPECCCLKFAVLYLLRALFDERTGLQFAV
jgi:hypothetical protein